MNFIKIFGIIFLSLLLSTNAYSKKPLKTGIIFESENGGIYSIKLPMVSGKGRWQPAFDIVNALAEKNCSQYSKNSYMFLKPGSAALTIQPNGKLKVNAMKTEPGLLPDASKAVNWKYNYYRFFCGQNIEEVLINHSASNKIFPAELYHTSDIGEYTSKYINNKNKQFIVKDVTEENRKKISLKVKEISQGQTKTTLNTKGMATGNVAKANFGNVIGKAKETCKDLGFNSESEKFSDCVLEVVEISDAYAAAKAQENILIAKAKEQENIDLEFNYETSSGQKIQKESKWTKFWQGAAWILYEYGDEILALALDLKYDTNLSGYNTTEQVSANSGGLRCVSQRRGKVVHQNCKGADGTHIYCMYQQIGKHVKRTCRDKSRY